MEEGEPYSDEVEAGPDDDEEVPECVVHGDLLPFDVEVNTGGVRDAPHGKELENRRGQAFHEGVSGEHNHPPHADVQPKAQILQPLILQARNGDTDDGHGPDEGEHPPRVGHVAEDDHHEGGVGAGDEDVDHGVVENTEDGAGVAHEEEGVAEGGGQVEGDKGHHEDRRADHMHLAARARVTGGGRGGEVGVVCEMARCGVSWSPSSS